MIFPYSTDAPIYHLPLATGGLIIVNTIAFAGAFAVSVTNPDLLELFVLQYGTWNPLQWVTSIFLHGDIMHLIGNMMFLWAFGLVVEGKVGWWRFLLIYLGIGVGQSAVEQTLALGMGEGGSLGASAAIYGLLAISLIWAPKNDMSCFAFIYFYPIAFDIPILTMCGIAMVVEFVLAGLMIYTATSPAQAITSSILHLMGAAGGFAVGAVMVKQRWVDCENWDLFSVWAGRHHMSREELRELREQEPDRQQQRERRAEAELEKVRRYIESGQPVFAYNLHVGAREKIDGWRLPPHYLLHLIKAYHARKLWIESIPAMREYCDAGNEGVDLVRLKLAEILVTHKRRGALALRVMSQINRGALAPKHLQRMEKLSARAAELHEQDPYEVADDW